jgi:hypothetical protein
MSGNAHGPSRITRIWLLLLLLTAVSWWLGRAGDWLVQGHRNMGLVIVVLAFVKIRFVILDFMEVRNAPIAMRAACETWVVAVCAAILMLCRF